MITDTLDARYYWHPLRGIKTAIAAIVAVSLGRGGFHLLNSPSHLKQQACGVRLPNLPERNWQRWLSRFKLPSACKEMEDPLVASDEPPPYFFNGVSRKKALQNWEETKAWRKENNIGAILHNPPPKHDFIRSLFPTSLYQHDRGGNVVVVEKWGEVDVDRFRKLNLPLEEIIYTYTYDTEWMWRIALPHSEDKITRVMDLKNVSFETFTAWDTMRLIRGRIDIGCRHYPNRAANLLVVNVPSFFASVFRLAEPLLSSEIKKKITIFSEDDVSKGKMTKFIDPKNLLPEYGGRCKVPFGASKLDMKLKRFVQQPFN